MTGMPTSGMFFLVFWWGMVGAGLLAIRVWVVDRLRINNGGVESTRLSVGRRIADTIVALVIAFAMFWLIMAILSLISIGPQ